MERIPSRQRDLTIPNHDIISCSWASVAGPGSPGSGSSFSGTAPRDASYAAQAAGRGVDGMLTIYSITLEERQFSPEAEDHSEVKL